ncbi:dermonecrotic toxin domain-containing protein [Pseudomonas libanensis]|nr:DUF6543 domain-containing protein [Pseudomonas libanensis]
MIEQHQTYNQKITDLLSHQMTLQRFIQAQLKKTFPQLKSIDPNIILVNTYRQQPPAEPVLISTQTLSEALLHKVVQVYRDAITGTPNAEEHGADTQTDFYINGPAGDAQTKLEHQGSLLTLAKNIATRFPEALSSYWNRPPEGSFKQPSRLAQLSALHRQMLSTEAALRFEDGTLSETGKKLIDTAFQYPTLEARERELPAGDRPGVYPIRVDDNSPNGALLAGCFLITRSDGSSAEAPYTASDTRSIGLDDTTGPVVLYTPGEGFEEFASPGDAREALMQRINNDDEKATQLLKSLPLSVEHSRDSEWGDDLLLGFAPVSGDVVAQTFPQLLRRQADEVNETMQSGFAEAQAETGSSRTPALLSAETAAAVDDAADLSLHFDGSNALLARNEQLHNKLQPQWLKELPPEQETNYRKLEEAEHESLMHLQPLLKNIPPLDIFAKQLLAQALKAKLQDRYPNEEINPDNVMVQIITQQSGNIGLSGVHNAHKQQVDTKSLTELALMNTAPWTENSPTSTWTAHVVGANGNYLLTLDKPFLEELISQTDVGGRYLNLLDDKLSPTATSDEARALPNACKDLQKARMAKDAFITSLDPDAYLNKQKIAEQWIKATLEHDDATTWPIVNGASIVSHSVAVNGKPIQGMLVIKPTNHPSLVLYSPDAPDGRPFREIVDEDQLNKLLDTPQWKTYMDQRESPVDRYGIHDDLFLPGISRWLKTFAADHEAGIRLKPIKGGISDSLYMQELGLLRGKALVRMTTSAEVSARSTVNKLMFATDMAQLVLSPTPVSAGTSAINRLSKAALRELRAPGRSLPRLLTQPGRWGAVYNDFAMAASGVPLLKRAPLRPVFKAPAGTSISAGRPSSIPAQLPNPAHPVQTLNRGDLAAHALDNHLLVGKPLSATGPQQVGDKWLIRYTDNSGMSKVYQISPVFKFESGFVNVINPQTGRRVATLLNKGNGEWAPTGLPGGARLPATLEPLPQPPSATSTKNLLPSSSSSDAGSWRIESPGQKPLPVLVNTRARDLNAEMHLAGAALNPRAARAELMRITTSQDLNVVLKTNTVSKFVFTQDNQLIIGTIDKSAPPKWLSHPAIAEIGAGSGQSEKVVSAGYIRKDALGKFHLSNVSGHYQPRRSDLRPVQEYLRNMGVDSTKSKFPIP